MKSAGGFEKGSTSIPKKEQIIRHALGLDRSKKEYRNNYFAGPDHEDYPVLEALVMEGKMVKSRDVMDEMNESYVYVVTPGGRSSIGL